MESALARVPLGTRVTNGTGSQAGVFAMAYKLLATARNAGGGSTATTSSLTSSTALGSRTASGSLMTITVRRE